MSTVTKVKKMYWEELPTYNYGAKSWIDKSCRFEYDNVKGSVSIINYNVKNGKLGIKYLNKDLFYIGTGHFKNCRIGVMLGEHMREHIYDIGTIVNNLEIIDKNRMARNNGIKERVYKYKCLKCGFDCGEHYKNGKLVKGFWISESHLKIGVGCSCCYGVSSTVVTSINSMWKTDYWMVKLGVDEEFSKTHTKGSREKAPFKCPDCGKNGFKRASNIYIEKSISCSCRDSISYPEKILASCFNQLELIFDTQLSKNTFEWCKNYRYDFIVEHNIIMEVHGLQHYGRGFKYKGGRTLEEEQENDRLKQELALSNGIIEYIVIDCRKSELEFIKNNILTSKLSELYDLSNIDWNKCGEYAMSNLSKMACDLFNDSNGCLTTTEIGVIIGVSRQTIITWLKQWSKLEMCEYYPGANRKIGKRNCKPIEVFKDGISKGKFKSINELSRQSEKIYGVKLNVNNISKVANGNRKQHKGFTFKFAS